MPLYALIGFDKPNALDLRMAHRDAHLAWVQAQGARVRMAGPLLSEADAMEGSMLFIEADSLEDARAFSAADPYAKAGLFERVEIRRFRSTVGQPL